MPSLHNSLLHFHQFNMNVKCTHINVVSTTRRCELGQQDVFQQSANTSESLHRSEKATRPRYCHDDADTESMESNRDSSFSLLTKGNL